MPIALALVAFACLAQAVEWGWIGPRTALGGFVLAAIVLAAGMFDGRGMGGRDETAAEDQAEKTAQSADRARAEETVQAADRARAEDQAGGGAGPSARGGFGDGGLGPPPRRALPRE